MPNVINKNSNDMKEEILSIASDLREGSMSTSEAKEQLLVLFGVVGQSEQLSEEKLCRMNQNFVCNCIDDSRCPNFRG